MSEGDEENVCTQPSLLERSAESGGSSLLGGRPLHLNPVWVQCSSPTCQKWRLLRDTFDAAEILDDWFCHMNGDKNYNNCEDAEESYVDESDDDNFGFIYAPFSNGSVVWAAADGYSAWWPGMIVPDPEENLILQTVSSLCPTVDSYHVVFFGRRPTRAWISAKKVKAFGKFDPKTDPVRDTLVLRTVAQWNNGAMKEARGKAQQAFDVKNIRSRLRVFGHMSYFKRLVRPQNEHQLSQEPSSPVRRGKPPFTLFASQHTPAKRAKSHKKIPVTALSNDRLANRKRLINETIGEVASGADKLLLNDSSAISSTVAEVVEAVSNWVLNAVKKPKWDVPTTDDASTAKKFKAPVATTEKNLTAAKKPRTKKFNAPSASTSNDTRAAVKKPRTKKPKASVSAADVPANSATTELEQTKTPEQAVQSPQTIQEQLVTETCALEAVAVVTMLAPSPPGTTISLESELVSLSQHLRRPPVDLDVSQNSYSPIAQSTPMMRIPLSTLYRSSQECPDETDKRTRALCEAAAERLNSFLNLSHEMLNASIDIDDSEGIRALSQPQSQLAGSSDALVTSSLSLSQQLRRPPIELNVSQESLPGLAARSQPPTPTHTPRTPSAVLVNKHLNIRQEINDETDKRARAVCETAAKRLHNFLNLSQEALNTTRDDEDGENARPLSQAPANGRREKTPHKTFAPTFKPLFAKIAR